MTLTLAFDVTAGRCAVALFEGGGVISERSEIMDKGHAERLFPMIDAALTEAGRAYSQLSLIAVCTGPGNFTGARIGVAAARGLALSTSANAVGVDRFEALGSGRSGAVCVALAARGGALHICRFEDGVIVMAAETAQAADCARFAADAIIVGDGAEALAAATGEGTVGEDQGGRPGDAPLDAIARIAAAREAAGGALRPAPRYLRPVNAALPRERPPAMLT